jgi:hypothetical protein
MTKLCKNCKHYRSDHLSHFLGMGDRYDMCVSPNTTQNLVTGHQKRFCDMLRSNRWQDLDYSCTPEGRFWEPK